MSKKLLASRSPGRKYFLYVGNAYPHKNLSRLIEAIVLLNREVDDTCILKIVSSRNIFTQRLVNMIKNTEAENYVELLGFVPDSALERIYKDSAAFVSASLSEGFGLPGLEAIEAGALVLASNIPVFKEVYQDHVIYFDPYDVRSIEVALEQALSMTKADREKRIRKAKDFAKRYSWVKMARETLKVYEEAAKSRTGLRQGK